MMKEALALQRESWCRLLTPGILRPSLGRLRPSASTNWRPGSAWPCRQRTLHNPIVAHVRDVKVASSVHRQPPRLVELRAAADPI